jgi:hypothetical protein
LWQHFWRRSRMSSLDFGLTSPEGQNSKDDMLTATAVAQERLRRASLNSETQANTR